MRTFIKKHYRKYKKNRALKISKNPPFVLPNGYRRIYHVHIRKTAGTSINSAFWELGGLSLSRIKREPLAIGKRLVFVRNNKDLIQEGSYFYANSHFPVWNINLPEKTFTFCMFREPYQRLLSLYKYHKWTVEMPEEARKKEPFYISLQEESNRLIGKNFSDYLDNIPRKHLMNQLFMFSEKYNIDEAMDNVSNISAVYFQEYFDQSIIDLANTLELNLNSKNERRANKNIPITISEAEEKRAKEMLRDEYHFYKLLKSKYENSK